MNQSETPPLHRPFVSVVMPVRNEAHLIAQSVSAVLRQDYPAHKMEIIIADGMSEDETLDIIRSLVGTERVQILPNPRRIQAAGLNRAIETAHGDIIVRVDGHTVIAADYVRQCVKLLSTTEADNVGGHIYPVGLSPMGKAIAAASLSPFAIPSAFRWDERGQYTDTVYLGAWRREVFQRVGLFDETLVVNEDYELNYRIRRAGGRIYLSPTICSEYYGSETLLMLAQQHVRYGWWKPQTIFKHPASLRFRHLAAPALVAFLAGGVLILLGGNLVFKELWWFALGLYLILNAGFSLSIGLSKQVSIWRLLLVFTTIHIAWGIGFWCGLLHIRLRLRTHFSANES